MNFGEIIAWMIATIVKFIFTPSVMIGAGKRVLDTWVITSVGAALGFMFFYYLGNIFFKYIHNHRKKRVKKNKSLQNKNVTVYQNQRFERFGVISTIYFGSNSSNHCFTIL